jgi:agmatinase
MSDFFNLKNNTGKSTQDILVLGIPWDKSSSYRLGAENGPNYIRKATSSKIYNNFTELGIDLSQRWNISDLGNIDTKSKILDDIRTSICRRLDEKWKGEPILFLGGDHLVTYLCLHALKPKNTGIIYFDAHPDLYDSYENDRYSHACVLRRVFDTTEILPEDVVQIGIRASTKQQSDFSEKNDVLVYTRKKIESIGYNTIGEQVKKKFGHLEQIYVSFDLDVLDPAYAPGVGNPEPGGLSTSNIIDLIHELGGLPIKFFDIVEINPDYDKSNITGYLAAKIIKEMLGIIS